MRKRDDIEEWRAGSHKSGGSRFLTFAMLLFRMNSPCNAINVKPILGFMTMSAR